jgi:hypothetical protein
LPYLDGFALAMEGERHVESASFNAPLDDGG